MRIQRALLILCSLCALLASTAPAAPLRPAHAPHAIVTSFARAVVHPQAGNLGGGGFLLLRSATGKTHFIDFREKAPAAATENMYLHAQGNVLPESHTKKNARVVTVKWEGR